MLSWEPRCLITLSITDQRPLNTTHLSCTGGIKVCEKTSKVLLNSPSFFSETEHALPRLRPLIFVRGTHSAFPGGSQSRRSGCAYQAGRNIRPRVYASCLDPDRGIAGKNSFARGEKRTILVTGGNSITIEPLPNGNRATIMQILLGWALGGLFHQRACSHCTAALSAGMMTVSSSAPDQAQANRPWQRHSSTGVFHFSMTTCA